MTDPVTDQLARARILPVIVADDPATAPRLGRALLAAGLAVAEITFRTDRALDVLRALAADTDLTVGAGTVISVDQVDQAIAAGARFIVSPGLDAAVVRRCHEHGVPAFPGIATATELTAAHALGLRTVKFFPAEPLGGLTMIGALAGPFGGVRFIPTGGITPGRLPAYLAHPAVLAVGGSWMVPPDAITAGDWTRITALTADAVAAVNRT